MCRNGGYTERGIKGRHGFGSEKVALEAEFAVRVPPELGALGVLSEPASIVAKAWEQIDRISARACAERSRVLVTGAGPIGMLAALLAAERDLEVHVLDRAEGGVKPGLVRDLGGHYHSSSIAEASEAAPPDVVVECTGVGELVLGAMTHAAPGAIVCLAGVGASSELRVDMGKLNNEIVFGNRVVFGSVNANRRHFDQAIAALVGADRAWLARLITRTVPFERWQEALERGEDDVKAVVELAAR
jgi:threonine dehydrogenase-like Zn-dependent dehydrogenase